MTEPEFQRREAIVRSLLLEYLREMDPGLSHVSVTFISAREILGRDQVSLWAEGVEIARLQSARISDNFGNWNIDTFDPEGIVKEVVLGMTERFIRKEHPLLRCMSRYKEEKEHLQKNPEMLAEILSLSQSGHLWDKLSFLVARDLLNNEEVTCGV